ncbi:MAG: squalene/phytoene synthase family protein [Sandaracinaceae bacterium]
MIPERRSYDVVVVGAGPAGSVAALAHARRGAEVLLLEADPRVAGRFAGEWMHPTGVAVLDSLRIGRLEPARARAGYGFVIHPDDGSDAIEMPYSQGVALSAEHGHMVGSLRSAAGAERGVELVTHARAVRVEPGVVRVEDRETGAAVDVRAGRIVGAEGKRSVTRDALDLPERSVPLGYMAGVELRDVELPREGFGHVILGGPGPALFYRISDDVVRGCLDVPLALGPQARSREFLWDSFSPVVPAAMRPALRRALAEGPSGWAINRFQPRTSFGRGDVMLVGDAVGHVHPMTAMGMSLGLADAQALAASDDVEAYAKTRRAYIPELLSNALYHCFRREDPSATAVRRAMFDTLRKDAHERGRTMDILAGADPSRRAFGGVFLRIAAQAVGRTLTGTELSAIPSALAGFGEWMQWPAALAFPSTMDTLVRARSNSTHPIPQLENVVPTAAPVAAPENVERGKTSEVPLTPAIERGCVTLLAELEDIAMRIGTVPDAHLAGPALSCMRAILATEMRIGMAARMTLGRRRLATEGFTRLMNADGVPAAEHLAELVLVLFDGATWEEQPIASLPEAVRALLDHQLPCGAFRSNGSSQAVDVAGTALACRALEVLLRRRPDATDADLNRVLDRAAEWARAALGDDGSVSGDLSLTALTLETLLAAGAHPGEPEARRAVKWVTAALEDDAALPVKAQALRSLVFAGAPMQKRVLLTARELAAALSEDGLEWQTARELVEALAMCEARRVARPRKPERKKKAKRTAPPEASPLPDEVQDDWAFCKESLEQVSRTFSRPIALLPDRLEVAVSLGYLLCRVADTVEDHTAVPAEQRDDLFRLFLGVLENGDDATPFMSAFEAIEGDDAELRLSRQLDRAMRVFHAQDERTQAHCVRWVAEMTRGMNLYTSRRPGDDGFLALHGVSDLERYCYYVAGTVGHLLTDLFIDALGEDPDGALALALRDHAEGFATGLQLTNILKDVTDDHARQVSFVPRPECIRNGFTVTQLLDDDVRERAHETVAPLFAIARERLDQALTYALLVPCEQVGIRLFCLLPLWMAARTLAMATGNEAMFIPGKPVKITRAEVEALIAECLTLANDDDALRARYARLYDTGDLVATA